MTTRLAPVIDEQGRAATLTREAVILTHMLGRYLDDFGNVIRYLDRDGFTVTVYASPRWRPSSSVPTAPG